MTEFTNSLERALLLLETIKQAPEGLRKSEIGRNLKIPKSSCSYIIERLERNGFLEQDQQTGCYRIGLAAVSLAHGALRKLELRSVSEPVLHGLAIESGLSVGIGVLDRGRVLLVDRVEGGGFVKDVLGGASAMRGTVRRKYPVRSERDIGRELPVHSTALGKVLLSALPRETVIETLEKQALPGVTPKTIVSSMKLLAQIDNVRCAGYALADEEHHTGVRALSAPIRDTAGAIRAAVSANGHPDEPIWEDIPKLIELVKAAARKLSACFHARPFRAF